MHRLEKQSSLPEVSKSSLVYTVPLWVVCVWSRWEYFVWAWQLQYAACDILIMFTSPDIYVHWHDKRLCTIQTLSFWWWPRITLTWLPHSVTNPAFKVKAGKPCHSQNILIKWNNGNTNALLQSPHLCIFIHWYVLTNTRKYQPSESQENTLWFQNTSTMTRMYDLL